MEGSCICFFSSSSSSSYFKILIFSLSLFAGLCTSSFISDDIFGSQASIGRNLLQAKKPVDRRVKPTKKDQQKRWSKFDDYFVTEVLAQLILSFRTTRSLLTNARDPNTYPTLVVALLKILLALTQRT